MSIMLWVNLCLTKVRSSRARCPVTALIFLLTFTLREGGGDLISLAYCQFLFKLADIVDSIGR